MKSKYMTLEKYAATLKVGDEVTQGRRYKDL